MKHARPLAALALLAAAALARAEPVSAALAEQRLMDGAQAWDVRATSPALLPGSKQLDAGFCLAALRRGDMAALSRAVSAAGIDLSRDVLIYGAAGDTRAQALHELLASVASGRVDWLVGGVDEWQLGGRRTVAAPAPHLPVPQYLVWRDDGAGSARMAGAALRDPVASAAEHLAAR